MILSLEMFKKILQRMFNEIKDFLERIVKIMLTNIWKKSREGS